MAEGVLEIRETWQMMERLDEKKRIPRVTEGTWRHLMDICMVLKPFEDVMKALESDKTTGSVVLPLVKHLRKKLVEMCSINNTLRDVIGRALISFDEKFGGEGEVWYSEGPRRQPRGFQKVQLMASALDPHVTNRLATYMSAEDLTMVWDSIAESARTMSQSSPEGQSFPRSDRGILKLLGENDDKDDDEVSMGIEDLVSREIRMFRSSTVGPLLPQTDDPLVWWKANECFYPLLARVARRALCVPASSASSERLFSVASQVITTKRARLTCKNASLLISLHELQKFLDPTPEHCEADLIEE